MKNILFFLMLLSIKSFGQLTITPEVGAALWKARLPKFESYNGCNENNVSSLTLPGWKVGVMADYRPGKKWGIESGIYLENGGWHIRIINDVGEYQSLKVRVNSLDLPVLVTYTIYEGRTLKVSAGIGGYADIHLFGSKWEGQNYGPNSDLVYEKLKIGNGDQDLVQPFDLGALANLHLTFHQLSSTIGYKYGIAQQLSHFEGNLIRNTAFWFAIGYGFKL